jgi:hypothetical protein
VRGYIFSDDTTGADDGPFAYSDYSAGTACDDHVRPHECFFLDYYLPSTSCMGDYYSPDANLNTVVNFDVLRVFIVEINVISDKYFPANLDATSAMPKWTQ